MNQETRIVVASALAIAAAFVCYHLSSRPRSASSKDRNVLPEKGKDTVSRDLDTLRDLPPTAIASVDAPSATTETGNDASVSKSTDTNPSDQQIPGEGTTKYVNTVEELEAQFNSASSMAKKLFSGQRYDEAAKKYGEALALCDVLEGYGQKRVVLHNNRSAAYEKAGKFGQALAECSLCLAMDPVHSLARVRKARVLDAMGMREDALAELCAHMILERDRMQAKAAMNPSAPIVPPQPPANLEPLLKSIAMEQAEKIMAERKVQEMKEKEREGIAGDGEKGRGQGGKALKPLVRQTVHDVLKSFGSFANVEREYKDMKESVLSKHISEAAEKSPTMVEALLHRGIFRAVKRDYEESREDIFYASKILSELHVVDGDAGSGGVPAEVEALVMSWKGRYLYLSGDMEESMDAYKGAENAYHQGSTLCSPDVMIMLGWLYLHYEKVDEAKEMFDKALELDPEYGSTYCHRAKLHGLKDDTEAISKDIQKAIALNENDTFSWEQLTKLHISAGNLNAAIETLDSGLGINPNSCNLLTAKAELGYSQIMMSGDPSGAGKIISLFEKAARADPLSPAVYANQALALLQLTQDVPAAMGLLEKAVQTDPTFVPALVQFGNLKINTASTMEEGQEAVAILERAVGFTTDKEDLVETLSIAAATKGRISGAKVLGRTSLR